MTRIASFLFLFTLLAGVAKADEPKRFEPDQVPAATYEFYSDETLVRYTVNHFGVNDFWGTFAGATGTMTLDPKNIGGTRIDVSIPIFQLQTTNRDLDAELYSSAFFDYIKFRDMHFVSTAVKRTGPRSALLTGDLTIRDVTKSVTFDVTFHGATMNPFGGDDLFVGFDATGSVKRSEFGLGKFIPMVSDETRIFISAEFKKQ